MNRGSNFGAAGATVDAIPDLSVREGFRTFDRLPRAMKRALWDSSLNLVLDEVISEADVEEWVSRLRALEAVSALEVWGPAHPQAPRAASLLDDERRVD